MHGWEMYLLIADLMNNCFRQKLGFHTQNGGITQSDNRDITQSFGFHVR